MSDNEDNSNNNNT